MQETKSRRAFNYESGQFICHIYATISSSERQVLEDVIQAIQQHSSSEVICASCDSWTPLSHPNRSIQDVCETDLHVTLLRGHRAVYYHQIRALIGALKLDCEKVRPFSICLDELKIFHNFEQTRQFLCISARPNSGSQLSDLKQKLQERVDKFAIKLTSEDETQDTSAHCSLMVREVEDLHSPSELDLAIFELNEICYNYLDEYPMCLVKIESIQVRVGNHIYNLSLTG